MSSALVLGHATSTTVMDAMVTLTNTVIGAGGRGDPLGERVQQKLSATVQPDGYAYDPVHYPATYDLAGSRDSGVPAMRLVLAAHSTEPRVIIAGYSEGSLVAERVRRDLQANPAGAPTEAQLSFVMIGSPFAPNGGVYNRFPGFFIPFIIDPITPSQPTRYDTTYHALEYDPFADFPAYFNPLALLNSALAIRYAHPDKYYDAIDPENTPHVEKVVDNTAGGKDTYILYLNPQLPLLGPIREVASILGLTPLTEPLLGAIEPLLRLAVDMAYTDRTYENAGVSTPFSLFTPPHKIVEALLGVPEALHEGLTNLLSESPSTLPALHDKDFRTARPAKAPDAEVTSESVAVQEDAPPAEPTEPPAPTEPAEVTAPTKPHGTDGRKPRLTSDGNKVTPIGGPDGTTTGTGAGTDPVTTTPPTGTAEADSDTKPAQPDTKPAQPSSKPAKPSAPDSENDRADAAA